MLIMGGCHVLPVVWRGEIYPLLACGWQRIRRRSSQLGCVIEASNLRNPIEHVENEHVYMQRQVGIINLEGPGTSLRVLLHISKVVY